MAAKKKISEPKAQRASRAAEQPKAKRRPIGENPGAKHRLVHRARRRGR